LLPGGTAPQKIHPAPLPSGKRSLDSLDDEHVFRFDILHDAAKRARGKSKGGQQRKVLRDWYILRAIAGLGAIGYRAAAACELVLEEVTGYKAATLRKIHRHRRARDNATEHELMLELTALREYRARSKAASRKPSGCASPIAIATRFETRYRMSGRYCTRGFERQRRSCERFEIAEIHTTQRPGFLPRRRVHSPIHRFFSQLRPPVCPLAQYAVSESSS